MQKIAVLMLGMFLGWNAIAVGATILFPSGGGTGTSTSPTYGQLLVGNRGGTYTLTSTSSLGIVGGTGSGASSTILADGNNWTGLNRYTAGIISLASSTFQTLNFGGVTGTSWSDFCVSITGSASLCDGSDATGVGGVGAIVNATGTPGQVAEFSALNTLRSTTSINVASLNATSSGSIASLTIGSLSGVLKAAAGLVSGSATTADVPEGSNLYYTAQRVRDLIQAAGTLFVGTTTAQTWTGNQTFTNASSTNFGITGQFYVSGTASSTFAGGIQATNARFSNLNSCDTIDTDANGVMRCGTDTAGAGGIGDVVNATGTPGQLAAFSALNALVSTTTANVSSIDATSTTRASVFSTLSVTNATSSTFAITNALNGLLKTDGNGSIRVASAGTDYQAALGAGTKGQILAYLGAGVPTWTATTTFSTGLTFSGGNVTCDTASGSVFGCLTSAFFSAFNNKISSTSLSASTPLSYNSGTGAFTIADAVANGSTKGAASFTANDFNDASGNISIDYTNGQAAASGVKGFLTAADWATFSGKENALTFGQLLTRSGNVISGSTSPSFAVLNATSSMTIGTLTGVLKAASGLVSTASNGTDFTLISATTCGGTDKVSAISASGAVTCSTDQTGGGGGAGFIVNATGTPGQLAVFSGLNSLISTTTLNVSAIDATSTSRFSVFNLLSSLTAFMSPNGANPTVDAAGELALDTTDNQLLVGDSGGTARVIPLEQPLFAVTVASTSPVFISGGNLPIPRWIKDGRVLTQYRCWVEGGTSVAIQVTDGTNATESITCASGVTSDTDVATNDTFTADEKWYIDFGTVTGAVNFVTFEAYGYITRE